MVGSAEIWPLHAGETGGDRQRSGAVCMVNRGVWSGLEPWGAGLSHLSAGLGVYRAGLQGTPVDTGGWTLLFGLGKSPPFRAVLLGPSKLAGSLPLLPSLLGGRIGYSRCRGGGHPHVVGTVKEHPWLFLNLRPPDGSDRGRQRAPESRDFGLLDALPAGPLPSRKPTPDCGLKPCLGGLCRVRSITGSASRCSVRAWC
jgi:hypothetical protein